MNWLGINEVLPPRGKLILLRHRVHGCLLGSMEVNGGIVWVDEFGEVLDGDDISHWIAIPALPEWRGK